MSKESLIVEPQRNERDSGSRQWKWLMNDVVKKDFSEIFQNPKKKNIKKY